MLSEYPLDGARCLPYSGSPTGITQFIWNRQAKRPEAFSEDDDTAALGVEFAELGDDSRDTRRVLGYEKSISTSAARDRCSQGTRATPHHLNKESETMTSGTRSYPLSEFGADLDRRGIPDTVLGGTDVPVNGFRDTDYLDALLC